MEEIWTLFLVYRPLQGLLLLWNWSSPWQDLRAPKIDRLVSVVTNHGQEWGAYNLKPDLQFGAFTSRLMQWKWFFSCAVQSSSGRPLVMLHVAARGQKGRISLLGLSLLFCAVSVLFFQQAISEKPSWATPRGSLVHLKADLITDQLSSRKPSHHQKSRTFCSRTLVSGVCYIAVG